MDIARLYEELGRNETSIDDIKILYQRAREELQSGRDRLDNELRQARSEARLKIETAEQRSEVLKKAIRMSLDGMDPLMAKLTAEKALEEELLEEEDDAEWEDCDEDEDDEYGII